MSSLEGWKSDASISDKLDYEAEQKKLSEMGMDSGPTPLGHAGRGTESDQSTGSAAWPSSNRDYAGSRRTVSVAGSWVGVLTRMGVLVLGIGLWYATCIHAQQATTEVTGPRHIPWVERDARSFLSTTTWPWMIGGGIASIGLTMVLEHLCRARIVVGTKVKVIKKEKGAVGIARWFVRWAVILVGVPCFLSSVFFGPYYGIRWADHEYFGYGSLNVLWTVGVKMGGMPNLYSWMAIGHEAFWEAIHYLPVWYFAATVLMLVVRGIQSLVLSEEPVSNRVCPLCRGSTKIQWSDSPPEGDPCSRCEGRGFLV